MWRMTAMLNKWGGTSLHYSTGLWANFELEFFQNQQNPENSLVHLRFYFGEIIALHFFLSKMDALHHSTGRFLPPHLAPFFHEEK